MKKIGLILIAVMALGIMGCNRTQTPQPQQEKKQLVALAKCDMVILEDGKLVFYDNATQETTTYTAETDQVLNAVYDDSNHLYYTVAKATDQHLALKMLDLNVTDPQPKLFADWQLTKEEIINPMTGAITSLFWDDNHENLVMAKTNPEDLYISDYVQCNIATGQVRNMNFEEFFAHSGKAYSKVMDYFFTEEGMLYYVNKEGKFCLNDNIDFSKVFDNNDLDDLGFDPQNVSPDGTKTVFSAVIYLGEGWGHYCVSSCDGHSQQVLSDSDIWDDAPAWLADGSLVYIGLENPSQASFDDTPSFVKIILPDQTVKVIAESNSFVVKPFDSPMNEMAFQEKIDDNIDLAILDHGKLTFYSSATDTYFPLLNETDSVVNGDFDHSDAFFYTVAIGDNLYLKHIIYGEYTRHPELLTSWDLKLEDCVSQTYGKVSPLMLYPDISVASIMHDFNWEYYSFENNRLYDYGFRKKHEGWDPDEYETDSFDEEFLKWDMDMEKFDSHDNNFYYHDGDAEYCVSDKIDFHKYVSEPSYYEDPEFSLISIDPTNRCVIYSAIIEHGDLGHGPLCFATLDGQKQLAFEDTDAQDMFTGWLNDGSLLYAHNRNIIRVSPDGTSRVFSDATDFVTYHK